MSLPSLNFATPSARANAADIQVIGVGMGRTGTLSLCEALEILGFGPCHHPFRAPDIWEMWRMWNSVIEKPSPEKIDNIFRGYKSAVDTPVAIMAKEMYNAYPNAKFILVSPFWIVSQ
ncbi:hypothetical protein M422DRAFT_255069 [Sphaerobolus stellatus SS14]|uniref:Sulfotransferase family protein n=1 Tax=Sphaerobolus stellatus (strain SS14) TaxID=990650 RepID=A0A0C9VTA1_SPHS4|nr:hypothetical protein M422DRAFT_255069 [Sphaerobolus stellatus SS14]